METESFIRFQYDNDFFSATDRYYTQGVMLSMAHKVFRYSPFSYALIKMGKKSSNQYVLHFEQDVFTPRSIRYMGGAVYYGERPFTAVFFVSHRLTSFDPVKTVSLKTNLDLGILGPFAKGEEEQKGIHKALDNIQPQGWENQLSHSYVINYGAELEKIFLDKKYVAVSGLLNARLGTLYTDAAAGLHFRVGILEPWFKSLLKHQLKKSFQVYLDSKFISKIVGYNATLQGGINSVNIYELPSAALKRLVGEAGVGLVVRVKKLSLEYRKIYLSPEFNGGLAHSWGSCVITVAL